MSTNSHNIAKCPTCSQILKYAIVKAGTVANCPKCNTAMLLPEGIQRSSQTDSESLSRPSSNPRPPALPRPQLPAVRSSPTTSAANAPQPYLPSQQSTYSAYHSSSVPYSGQNYGQHPSHYPSPPSYPAYPPNHYSASQYGSHGYAPMPAVDQYGIPYKTKVAAGLLGFFLGTYGAHNFYLGRTGIALTQLFMTLIGLVTLPCFGAGLVLIVPVGIWALVETILCFTGGMPDGYGRPLV